MPLGNDRLLRASWSAVPIHVRLDATAVRERRAGATTLEIVPLVFVEGPEKFGCRDPPDLASHAPGARDEAGKAAEIEERAIHDAFARQHGPPDEKRVRGLAAHERAVDEEERQRSTARSTALRKSASGSAPSNSTRSLITIFGTALTRYVLLRSGNPVASTAVARTRSDATAMCCARRTARGQ